MSLVIFAHSNQVKHQRWLFNCVLKTLLKSFAVFFLVFANLALAAPKQVTLHYQATRNGKPFANITETYQQNGDQYVLESVTEGVGIVALFGKRILKSEGLITADGLQPKHFELHQGDNEKKALYADFDWQTNQLSMKNKGNVVTEVLLKGTQDISSFPYQWMQMPPKGDEVNLPITTGKKLRTYNYKIAERDVVLAVEAGQFKTLHLVNASLDGKGNEKEFWLATEQFYLPVKIIQRDESGNVIEQTLTSMQIE